MGGGHAHHVELGVGHHDAITPGVPRRRDESEGLLRGRMPGMDDQPLLGAHREDFTHRGQRRAPLVDDPDAGGCGAAAAHMAVSRALVRLAKEMSHDQRES